MRCDSSASFSAITQFMRSCLDEAQVALPPPHRQDAIYYECPRQPSTVRLIRQVTPTGQVLAGVQKITTKVTREIFSEIVKNLQKFIPDRCRPRSNQRKPHLSHAYKPAV
jgi:hypothetical protein